MNDIARKEVMITMLPDKLQERLRDILEFNPAATAPELRKALTIRVRYLLGTAASDENPMDLDALGGGGAGGDEPGKA